MHTQYYVTAIAKKAAGMVGYDLIKEYRVRAETPEEARRLVRKQIRGYAQSRGWTCTYVRTPRTFAAATYDGGKPRY